MSLLVMIHVLAAIVWVGGMFFAYVVLRPAAAVLPPAERLALWRRVLSTFFVWVFVSIGALLVTGYGMLFLGFGGFAGAGWHIHLMQLTGLVMMALFLHLYFAPWRRLRAALDTGDLAEAGRRLGQVRLIVAVNLGLGLVTSAVAVGGRYWP